MGKHKRKAYPAIGGPLDGVHLPSDDFESGYGAPGDRYYRPPGRFAAQADDYISYNCGSSAGRGRRGAVPTMVWLHRSLLSRAPQAPAAEKEQARPKRSGQEIVFNASFQGDEDLVAELLLELGAEGLAVLTDAGGDPLARFVLRAVSAEEGRQEVLEALAALDAVSVSSD